MTTPAAERVMALLSAAAPRAVQLSRRYSRFVGVMKFVLPGIALLVSAGVIVLSQSDPEPARFGVTVAGARSGEAEPGMSRGRFIGTDEHQRPFTVTADSVRPEPGQPNRFAMQAIQADLTLERGTWISLLAPQGSYDRVEHSLSLRQAVEMYSDDGFALRTASADVDLRRGIASGSDEILVQGPLGRVRADAFRLSRDGELLTLTGNVRLTVFPATSR
jgi:lipopolysaccharide export system protein LptC